MQTIITAQADCKSNSASRPDKPRDSGELARPLNPPAQSTDVMLGSGALPLCEHCGQSFESRKHGGGSPQRFCCGDCRQAFHSGAQRGQRSPACTLLPAVIDPLKPKPSADAPASAPEANSDFDWNADDSVVLHHQPAVAAYINQAGGLTIRQERSWDQDEDIIIAIAPENVGEFVDKLTDVIGIPSFGK